MKKVTLNVHLPHCDLLTSSGSMTRLVPKQEQTGSSPTIGEFVHTCEHPPLSTLHLSRTAVVVVTIAVVVVVGAVVVELILLTKIGAGQHAIA